MSRGDLSWHVAGPLEVPRAVAWLEQRRDQVLANPADPGSLLLTWHPPVITLGRHAQGDHVLLTRAALAERGVAVEPSTRGGDVTYHDTGQLMIYPVVRLPSVKRFIAELAEAVAEVAAALGVPGAIWSDDPPGLWLADRKLAACGLHVHRGVSVHGFALNLATESDAWKMIVPCGLSRAPVSIAEVCGAAPHPREAAEVAGPILCRGLGYRPLRAEMQVGFGDQTGGVDSPRRARDI